MNLHELASGLIGAVNPMINVPYRKSTGYTTTDDGTRIPTYAADSTIRIQLQGMSETAIKHMNELNVGGILRTVFANGSLQSIDRKESMGGDLLIIDGVTWLVVHVLGQWPDWCSVVIQKQVD